MLIINEKHHPRADVPWLSVRRKGRGLLDGCMSEERVEDYLAEEG